MTFNSTSKFYEYNRSVPDSGTFKWNVTCNGSSSGYDVLTVNDTIPILADTSLPGISFVDPTDSLRKSFNEGINSFFEIDTHLNKLGHQVVYELLFSKIHKILNE